MKIRLVELHTHRLEELKAFYSGVLALKLIAATRSSFTLQIGESRLRFIKATGGGEPFYHFAFNIPENQLSEALTWVRERATLLSGSDGTVMFDFPHWKAHAFYFTDPAGNILECIARHDLDNASHLEFSAAALLNLSEIGLPVAEPLAFCQRVTAELGILPYPKSMQSDQFATMGNEEGLLIVVPLTKMWLPTDQSVQVHPVHVMIESDRKGMLQEGVISLQLIDRQEQIPE